MNKTLVIILFIWVFVLQPDAQAQSFDYLPKDSTDMFIYHTFYTLAYSETHEQPKWVAYKLEPQMLFKVVKRKNNFREDTLVTTGSATYDDYNSAPLYDAGHMLPSRDMQFSCESMDETFYMSNMSPQHKQLNRKRWAHLESLVRSMVERNGPLYIVTGPVISDTSESIGIENQVSIPDYFYKIVLQHDSISSKCIAFLLPNEKCRLKLNEYVVSIDSIEVLTGIDFFPSLEDQLEMSLESLIKTSNWSFKKPRSNFGYQEKAVKCN